jgi:hypothetical protein
MLSVLGPDDDARNGTQGPPLSLKCPTTFTPDVLVQIPPAQTVCGSSTTRQRIRAGRPSIVQLHDPKYHLLTVWLALAISLSGLSDVRVSSAKQRRVAVLMRDGDPNAPVVSAMRYAKILSATTPATSVRRKSRPEYR